MKHFHARARISRSRPVRFAVPFASIFFFALRKAVVADAAFLRVASSARLA